jgi:type II secretory pathway component PulK
LFLLTIYSHHHFGSRRERGLALLMVMVLLVVMVLVVSELMTGARVQRMASENLIDDHFAFYGEQTALIKAEEILFQDIEPPPRQPLTDLILTPEQLKIEQKKAGTDSFHDHWAQMREVEKVGQSWMMMEISDEDRRFNVNTLIDQRTGQWVPKRKTFMEELLKAVGVKDVDVPSLLEEFKDHLDPNDTGKYESKEHNGPLKLLSQLLNFENIDGELYYGKAYPTGELFTEEDFFNLEQEAFGHDFEVDDFESADEDRPPFEDEKATPYEEWDEEEVFPGLKDVLTVYGDGKINLNTAPLPILVALFKGDEKTALEVIRARKLAPLSGHEDLRLVPGATNGIAHYGDMIAYQSNYFRVLLTLEHRRVRRYRVSMMMREGPQAITLFRGAPL